LVNLLAEAFLSIDLDTHGFSAITKLRPIKVGNQFIPTADFSATLGITKFAIELKVVRIENNLQPDHPIGDPSKSYWWGKMFRANAITKIEDDNRKVIEQLNNTCKYMSCSHKLLVIHSFRLGPSILMDEREYINELQYLKNQFPEIDYFCSKDSSGDAIVIYPPMSKKRE